MKSSLRTLTTGVIALGLAAIGVAALAQDAPLPAPPADHNSAPPPPPRRWGERPPTSAPAEFPPNRERRPGPDKPLTTEQIQDLQAILKEQDPRIAARLEEVLKSHPERVQELLANHWPRVARLVELKHRDGKLFALTMGEIRLNRAKMELVEKFHKLDGNVAPTQVDELKAQLKQIVSQQFDLRQQIRRREIENLEHRLAELRKGIEDREHKRTQILDEHVNDLLKAPTTRPAPKTPPTGF